jgi:glycopeptide antibiotics resistance protein
VLLAAWLLLLLDMTLRWFPEKHPAPNLVPFRSMRHDWGAGGWSFWVNLVGNVVAFVPFGVLVPRCRTRPTSAWSVGLVALALSGAIELAQYLSGRRIADIDDVLLNVAGALLGYGLAGVAWPAPARRSL